MMTHTQNTLLRAARKALICAPAVFLFAPALAHAAPAAQVTCQMVRISNTQVIEVCETKRESTKTIMTGQDAQNSQWSRANTPQAQPRNIAPTQRKTWTLKGRAHQA